MRSRSLLLLAAIIGLAAPEATPADNAYGGSEVVIAILDTGVRPTHQEFTYCNQPDPVNGSGCSTDQFVAWWDFSGQNGPREVPPPGTLWDGRPGRSIHPFDGHGHGTWAASMAAGLNVDPAKDPSVAPGFKLAIAKVIRDNGSVDGNLPEAIRWAVDTVGADVVSISIGTGFPVLETLQLVHEAARYARAAGALVTVANGNGFLGAKIPGDPGWASGFGNSTHVLAVGGNDATGPNQLSSTPWFIHTEPEVSAKFSNVRMASHACDTCYQSESGTSFANPFVAGMAAAAIKEARDNGITPTPDSIETLLKYSAIDTPNPPMFEGYGVLTPAVWAATVRPHAAAGTLPARPSPDLDALWVESVQNGVLRETWANTLDGALARYLDTGISPATGAGVMASSAPSLAEGERYTLPMSAGEQATVTLTYPPGTGADADLYVFSSAGPDFSQLDMVWRSARGAGAAETVAFRAPVAATYTVFAIGSSVGVPVTITVTSTSTDAGTPEASFAGESFYVVTIPR